MRLSSEAEQRAVNSKVPGSIPGDAANLGPYLSNSGFFAYPGSDRYYCNCRLITRKGKLVVCRTEIEGRLWRSEGREKAMAEAIDLANQSLLKHYRRYYAWREK